MRIDRVEIDGFGKLNNCSYDFSDGLNLIYGENESGKSTLCEFILAMFYGLPNETKRASDDMSARKKYRPWKDETFGGRLYFTDNDGKKFVIERSFRATKRSDKVTLRNADTWEEIPNAESVGENLFGLSREAFLKTLYVKSFGADNLKSDDGEIMSRLSNLETSGDEDVSYSKILNAMEKEIYSLKTKTSKGGKIVALEEKLNALNNERALASMTYSALENDKKISENLKNEADIKENEAKILEKEYAIALQHEKYLAQKKVEETKTVIEERLLSEEEKLKDLKSQLKKLNEDEELTISSEEINRARAQETKRLIIEEKMAQAKKDIPEKVRPLIDEKRVIPGFFGLVVFIIGFLIKSIITYIAGILIAVVGILVCLCINIKKRKDDDKKREAYYELKHEFEKINEELESVFSPYGVLNSDELSALFVSANDKEKRASLLEKQIKTCENEIDVLKKSLTQETKKTEFSENVIGYSGESAEKLFEKINVLKTEQKEMTERANEILVRIARETAEIRSEEEILSELESVLAEKQDAEKRYGALTKANEWLNLAHQEIKNNFAPRLNQKASLMLSLLTNEKYNDLKANDTFDINLKSSGGEIVEANYMSRGTYDLLYIALRFAAMSVLTDGKIPPVILDDAFSQLDDTRLKNAVSLIGQSDEFSQVLLFTCHENYKEILAGHNVSEL